MNDSIVPFSRFSSHQSAPDDGKRFVARPLIASFHVARCVHFPQHLASLDGAGHFFQNPALDAADRVYKRTMLFLETLFKEEPFLS